MVGEDILEAMAVNLDLDAQLIVKQKWKIALPEQGTAHAKVSDMKRQHMVYICSQQNTKERICC